MKYARVITESKTRHTDCFYTYRTPDDVRVGDVVEVSFGKGERRVRGVVFGFVGSPDVEESRIKDISAVLDEFSLTEEIVETCVWMRQRYGIKYIDAVRCFLPKGRSARAGKVKDPLKEREPEEQARRRSFQRSAAPWTEPGRRASCSTESPVAERPKYICALSKGPWSRAGLP